jgi:hypothetical protein
MPEATLEDPALRLPALFLLAACASGLPDEPPVAAIRPEVFFDGVACGRGVLTAANGTLRERLLVTSRGRREGDGIVLSQEVRGGDGPVRRRQWTMRPDGPVSYRGRLSGPSGLGASGDVRVRVAGGAMRIRYALDGPPLARMEQFLYLQDDGSVMNAGTVRIAGVPVRRLSERIEPQPGVATGAADPCIIESDEKG